MWALSCWTVLNDAPLSDFPLSLSLRLFSRLGWAERG
jgi:hypothetical protein